MKYELWEAMRISSPTPSAFKRKKEGKSNYQLTQGALCFNKGAFIYKISIAYKVINRHTLHFSVCEIFVPQSSIKNTKPRLAGFEVLAVVPNYF